MKKGERRKKAKKAEKADLVMPFGKKNYRLQGGVMVSRVPYQ